MGDVVLSLVLGDRGLMPDEKTMPGKLGQRPDIFVISNGTPEADTTLPRLVASFREAASTPAAPTRPPRTSGSS